VNAKESSECSSFRSQHPQLLVNRSMRVLLVALTILPTLPLFSQSENRATLTLVKEAGYNEMEIDLDIDLLGASNDTSFLSGTIEVTLNIHPENHQTDELTLDAAEVSASDFRLNKPGFFTNYNFEAKGLKMAADTVNPPGVVDPATGDFDASQYRLSITEGVLSGSAYTLATGSIEIDPPVDFSSLPIEGVGTGSGTVVVTPTTRTGNRQNYNVVLVIPVTLSQTLENIQDTGFSATTDLAGTIKAVGTTYVDLLDYPSWAEVQGLAENTQNESGLNPEISNYLLFSLGFDRDNTPNQLWERRTTGFSLKVGPGRIGNDLIIQWSADGLNWERVPQEAMISGSSLIEKYSTPPQTLVGFGNTQRRFYRVITAP